MELGAAHTYGHPLEALGNLILHRQLKTAVFCITISKQTKTGKKRNPGQLGLFRSTSVCKFRKCDENYG